MARSCCFSGGLGGRSVSLARGEDASPEILSCQQDLLKGSLEAAGLDLYGETSRVSICALRELELSTKIGQMPQLTGGLNDWIMYQCWESNSRPISPCLDAQIGSHTSHTSSPVSCRLVVLADDVPWLPLARANSKVEKCVLWSFAVRRHWKERRKGMGPYAMRALASTRWIASEVISIHCWPRIHQHSQAPG